MNADEMKLRTRLFALRVIKLVEVLPNSKTSNVLGRQLLRSATSVGANYRAAWRARSGPDFINKLGIVEEEADESVYWLELIQEAGLVPAERLVDLLQEANEITAIIVASRKTAKSNK